MRITRNIAFAVAGFSLGSLLLMGCEQTPTGPGVAEDQTPVTEAATETAQNTQTPSAATESQPANPPSYAAIPTDGSGATASAAQPPSSDPVAASAEANSGSTTPAAATQGAGTAPTAEQAPGIQSSTSAIEATMSVLQQSNNFWSSSRPSLAPRRDILSDVTNGFNDALNTAANTIGGLAGAPTCPTVTRTVDLNGITVKIDYGTGCQDPLTGKTLSGTVTMVKALTKVTSTFAGLSDGTRTLDGKSEMALSGTSLTLSGNSNLKGPKGITSTNLNEVFAYSDMGTATNFLDDRLTGNGTSSIVAPNGMTATTALKNLVYEPITCPLEPKSGSVEATAGPVKATMPVGDDGSAPWPLWCDGCGSVYVNGLKIGKVCWVGGVSFEPSIPIPGL
ncbi:MAG: hypothetical protein HYT87_13930 [Nitrospirae bacterium]|nr:hypothetical protein [Nitrospirota bacterium]